MAVNFPDSPSINDEFTSGARTWIWNGSVWLLKQTINVEVGNLNDVTLLNLADGQALLYNSVNQNWENGDVDVTATTVSDAPPSSPTEADLWFDSTSGNTYVYYDSYWIETIGSDGIASGGSVASLNAIPDVSISGVSDGQVLSYDGANSQWINETLSSSSYTPPNSYYLDYNTGTNDLQNISDGAALQHSDGTTDLEGSITVSSGFTKAIVELHGRISPATTDDEDVYLLVQRSTDGGSSWTDVKSLQATSIEEGSSGSYMSFWAPFMIKLLDTHGASAGSSVSYRFINNTATINVGSANTIRQWFDNTSSLLIVQEVA